MTTLNRQELATTNFRNCVALAEENQRLKESIKSIKQELQIEAAARSVAEKRKEHYSGAYGEKMKTRVECAIGALRNGLSGYTMDSGLRRRIETAERAIVAIKKSIEGLSDGDPVQED